MQQQSAREQRVSGTVSGAQKPALSLDNAPLCGSVCLFEVALVLLIEGPEFAYNSCVCLRCIQCPLVDTALNMNGAFDGKFGTLD